MGTKRQQLTGESLEAAIEAVEQKLGYRANQKGLGSFASSHEILGIIEEEVLEFKIAVHGNLTDKQKVEELLDIAVGALFGIASITSGGTDW